MNPNGYQTPDLASVLRTLAAYSAPPPPQTAPQPSFILSGLGDSTNDELEEGEYDPEEALLLEVEDNLSHIAPPQPLKPPLHTTETRKASPNIPRIDPTTITTWPAALRYVSSLIAREEAVGDRIRKLITVQHQHERQWWEGREALVKLQKGREEGRRRVDDILKAVGGTTSNATIAGPTPEDDAAELARYDLKVHRACTDMSKDAEAQLKLLRIPFFGLPSYLITPHKEDGEATTVNGELGGHVPAHDLRNPGIMKSKDLLVLQKRMLELLEDLCKD